MTAGAIIAYAWALAIPRNKSAVLNTTVRLAIDVGGTFTDTVLLGNDGTVLASTKILTSHENPADAAMQGALEALTNSCFSLVQVSGFVHGTTLATNALIERKGAKVATITTAGFRDILEIAYERRYDQYDISLEKSDFLVPRDRSFTILERLSANGDVLIELDETQVPGLIRQLRDSGATAVAICLLHSYANNSHEQRLRQLIAEALPNLAISISSEVSPEAREFDRLCTTIANAYIQPLMSQYLARFQERFSKEGLICPILMMTASGGMTTLETAGKYPVRLVESGPAGGAILAAHTAKSLNLAEVLSFDMGGTTAKLCLIDAFTPQSSRHFEIARAARFIKGSGLPVRIPVIEMIEIGAGGGSIASVDRLGRLTVGPLSAGSEPGPVAFDRGGTEPTVTDADVALGYIRAETFAEGKFTIDKQAAKAAIERSVGLPLSLDAIAAADGISRIVDESMASAGRMHAVESGKDLAARTMIAFGGNGPLHACRVARSAGVSSIVIPTGPGVGSAIGFLYAPVSFAIVRSFYTLLSTLDVDTVNGLLNGLIAEATSVVRQGNTEASLTTYRSAFMRYSGQGHEIEIQLPDRELIASDCEALSLEFEHHYTKQFSRPVPGMSIEILNWSVLVSTSAKTSSSVFETVKARKVIPDTFVAIHCDVTGEARQAACVSRETLQPGDCMNGPVLITEPQTTTFVARDFHVQVDCFGNLNLTRNDAKATS